VGKDIGPILEGWPYEQGKISVRKIRGREGRPKIQLRLDLGVLQMECEGRPDGEKPYGCDSLLTHFEQLLEQHRREHGTDRDFTIDEKHCGLLRSEAVQYYYRYLSEFVLEEYESVARDTARNLRVLDLCQEYAEEDSDRYLMEQHRPYIVMMNTRARAYLALRDNRPRLARRIVIEGLAKVREAFEGFGQDAQQKGSSEIAALEAMLKDIEEQIPVDPLRQLKRKLAKAVEEERYEDAARLRDAIRRALDTGAAGP